MMFRAEQLADVELERFSVNGYRGHADAPEFELVGGRVPVLVSAPHAVTHIREGRVKPSEDYTGAIALELARRCGCHRIVACRTFGGDPNYDDLATSAYKQALVRHVRENDIAFVLDLHGMVAASPALLALGSGQGSTVSLAPGLDERAHELLSKCLSRWCEHWSKPVTLNGHLSALRPTTIAQTVARETGAAALQVEIASQLRVPVSHGPGKPHGEPVPFAPDQIGEELQVRRSPVPEAVESLIDALACVLELGNSVVYNANAVGNSAR